MVQIVVEKAATAMSGYILNGMLAIVVAGFVASMVSPSLPDQWATIDDSGLHAAWEPDTGTLQLSIEITKNRPCQRVVASQFMRAVEQNAVETREVEFKGMLRDKILRAPLGQEVTIFDRATPARRPAPGHYLVFIQLFCELPPPDRGAVPPTPAPTPTPASLRTPVTLSTIPVQTLVVIEAPAVGE